MFVRAKDLFVAAIGIEMAPTIKGRGKLGGGIRPSIGPTLLSRFAHVRRLVYLRQRFVRWSHGWPAKLRHREPVFIADGLAAVASPVVAAAPETD